MSASLTFTGPSGAVVTYKGQTNFDDTFTPAPEKNDWGVDTLQRVVKGAAPKLGEFLNSLNQGNVYTFRGTKFYLQTWSPDKNPIYPEVALNYKGFIGGALPDRTGQGNAIEQHVTLSASGNNTNFGLSVADYGNIIVATRELSYITRQTNWRYIRKSLASTPTYSDLDKGIDPVITQSSITVTNKEGQSFTFGGAVAPTALVTALTPAFYNLAIGPRLNPIYGTPFFECEDVVTRLVKSQ